MNLIIDVGNSFIKLAVFNGDELLKKESIERSLFLETVHELTQTYSEINNVIIASVGRLDEGDVKSLKKRFAVFELGINSKLPFKNLYSTPKTLGIDRIALVCGAVNQFPDKNVLIIDAGTCITYDFIDEKHNYYGGAISPGIHLRYKSLNDYTANLPLLQKKETNHLIGDSTNNAIHSGVINGVVQEIDGIIDSYEGKYRHLTVILTGGDANFLSKQLKSSIFANSNFLLEGLNYILHFNLKE